MKRIAIFIPEFPVLSETFIERELVELVSQNKFDISIVSLKKGNAVVNPILKSKIKYIQLTPWQIICGLFGLGFFSSLKILFELLGKNKDRSLIQNKYLWLKSLGYAWIFKSLNVDQIHVHFLSEPSTVAYIVARILKIKLSISAHARDVYGSSTNPSLNPELVAVKAKYATFITLCNKKAYEKCLELVDALDRNKIHLIYHGIDANKLAGFTKSAGQKPERFCIYNVGRLVEKKGLEYLLKAGKILKGRGKDFVIKIAGYGPAYEFLNRLSSELQLGSSFEMLGDDQGVKNELAVKYLSQCDVFALPSIDLADGDSDGIPNAILEAGALKKAVVTTNAGSIGEIIEDGVDGLVIGQKNERELADALEKLMASQDLRARLGENLYKVVLEKFNPQKNISKIGELMEL